MIGLDPWAAAVPSSASLADPILDVAGIPAREILRRCAEIRRGHFGSPGLRVGDARGVDSRLRLLDFADLSDDEFVREVHRVLLGSDPSPPERDRRLNELREHASRMEIVVRIALSRPGRRARRPAVRGIGLRTLAAAGRAIEAAEANSVLAPATRRLERGVRTALNSAHWQNGSALRLVGVATVAGAAVVVDRRLRRASRYATHRRRGRPL
jgi:hypothetical protein